MSWFFLVLAGLFETGFAYCLGRLRMASGTEQWLWLAGFVVSMVFSMVLLGKATQTLPIGTAYPVWTGIGAVGTVIVGMVFLHEPVSVARLLFTATLITSVVGLKAVS